MISDNQDKQNTVTMWCMSCKGENRFRDMELVTWVPPRCQRCGSTALERGSVFDALFRTLHGLIPGDPCCAKSDAL